MVWLPDGGKKFEDIFIRFGATHERDRRTDRHRVTAIRVGDGSLRVTHDPCDPLNT